MIYPEVPGGDELLAWFGEVPTFHDAEIVSLSLNRAGASELQIHGWIMTDSVDPDGHIVLDKHAVITFKFEGILDLQLDGFGAQNVVAGLILQRATDRGRSAYYPMPEDDLDVEVELLPCYGLYRFIRAKKVTISVVPSRPIDGE